MVCAVKRVLQLQVPITGTDVHVFCSGESEISSTCMYSWSTDSVCWVNWTDYNTYKNVAQNIESDYYLRILLFGDFCSISVNGEFTSCYNISIYSENPFLQSFCNNANLFNPYANLDCALLLHQQLSDSIICMFGLPCYYFKVTPDAESVDYTFKEYVFHNIQSVKYIKLMIEDGQLPSSNPQMTEFDFEWDNDWEVEIGKTQFAQAFGDNAFPKQRDIVYVPMMKRMYEVNSAYDEKNEGLMWRSTTWKLGLIKWNEKTNIDQGQFEDYIDALTPNMYGDVFGKEYEEQERESGASQAEFPKHAGNNIYSLWYEDAIRSGMTATEKHNIVQDRINNRSMNISINMYNFSSVDSVVTYQDGYCATNGALSFIIKTPLVFDENLSKTLSKTLVHIGDIEVILEGSHLKLKDLDFEMSIDSTYMVCVRWIKDTFTVEMEVYKHKRPDNVPIYRLKPEMYYFDEEATFTTSYDERFDNISKVDMWISPAPLKMTNIKVYDNKMTAEQIFKESNKYTTTDPHCVLNDLARPVEAPAGFSVR